MITAMQVSRVSAAADLLEVHNTLHHLVDGHVMCLTSESRTKLDLAMVRVDDVLGELAPNAPLRGRLP